MAGIYKKISQIPQAILIITITLILSSIINMGCELCEISEIFVKYRHNKEIEVTVLLTDPNSLPEISQNGGFTGTGVLVIDGKSQVR